MPTYYRTTKEGNRLFLRGNLGDHCSCGWVCDALCDYPVGDGKTCDRKLCTEGCAHEVAPDTHYCADHKKMWDDYVRSGGPQGVLGEKLAELTERSAANVVPFKVKD